MIVKKVDLESVLSKLKYAQMRVDLSDPRVIDPISEAIVEIAAMIVQDLQPGQKKSYYDRAVVEVVGVDYVADSVIVRRLEGHIDDEQAEMPGYSDLYFFSLSAVAYWKDAK